MRGKMGGVREKQNKTCRGGARGFGKLGWSRLGRYAGVFGEGLCGYTTAICGPLELCGRMADIYSDFSGWLKEQGGRGRGGAAVWVA